MLEHAVRRRAQPHGAAPLRGPRSRSRSSSRTTPRARSRRWKSPTTPRTRVRGHPPGALHARAVDRARRLHGGSAQEVLPPRSRPRGPAALRVLRDLQRGRQGRRRQRSSSCGAPTIRTRAAAPLPTAAGPRRRCTGSRPLTPCPPRCGSTTTSSRARIPGADGRDLFEDLNPDSETVLAGLLRRAVACRAAGRRDRAVRAARLLLPRPRLGTGCARVQPDAHAQGHLGEAAGTGTPRHRLTLAGCALPACRHRRLLEWPAEWAGRPRVLASARREESPDSTGQDAS